MSDLSEKETLQHFMDGIKRAEGAARILGLYRSDPRWVHIAALLGSLNVSATQLALKGLGPQRRIIS